MWRRAWIGKAVGTAQSGVRYGGGPPDDREGKAKQARRERVSESMPGSRDIPASQARMRLCRPCNEVHPYTSTRNKSGISQRNGTTTPTCRVLAAASAPLHCSPWIPELCWLGSRVRSWQRSKQASGSSKTAKPALPLTHRVQWHRCYARRLLRALFSRVYLDSGTIREPIPCDEMRASELWSDAGSCGGLLR